MHEAASEKNTVNMAARLTPVEGDDQKKIHLTFGSTLGSMASTAWPGQVWNLGNESWELVLPVSFKVHWHISCKNTGLRHQDYLTYPHEANTLEDFKNLWFSWNTLFMWHHLNSGGIKNVTQDGFFPLLPMGLGITCLFPIICSSHSFSSFKYLSFSSLASSSYFCKKIYTNFFSNNFSRMNTGTCFYHLL